MKISKKDASLLMGLAGVLIGFLVYQFYYLDMQNKIEDLEARSAQLSVEISRLQELDNSREEYQTRMEDMKAEIHEIVNRFPAGVLPEDDVKLAYLSDSVEGQPYIFINSMSFTAPALLYTTNQEGQAGVTENGEAQGGTSQSSEPQSGESQSVGADEAASRELVVEGQLPTYYLFDSAVSMGVNCDYNGLKTLVDRIYQENSRRSIETLALAFDESTGLLQGNLTMDSYYLEGTDKVYAAPSLAPVQTGTDNIFGTVTGPVDTTAPEEETAGEVQE